MNDTMEAVVDFAKAVSYFVADSKTPMYRTKLNKLLFYAQFYHYKRTGHQLIQNRFIKDYYGPVVENLEQQLATLVDTGLIEMKDSDFGNTIQPKMYFKEEAYSAQELETLNYVSNYFQKFTSKEISDYSHKEPLWEDTELKEVIPLNKAGLLKGI